MNPAKFAENVRRAAGFHLVPLDALAEYLQMSRAGVMKFLADDGEKRSMPSTNTVLSLSLAFGLDPRVLMSDDPAELGRELAASFDEAPIRQIAKVPQAHIRVRLDSRGKPTQSVGNVTPMRKRGRKRANAK